MTVLIFYVKEEEMWGAYYFNRNQWSGMW